MVIKLKRSMRVVPIEDSQGNQIGIARYNPDDIGIIDRFKDNKHLFDELSADDLQGSEDVLGDVKNVFKTALDEIFQPGFYDEAFGRLYPTTKDDDGNPVIVIILKAILEDVKEQLAMTYAASEAKKVKYLEGYNE